MSLLSGAEISNEPPASVLVLSRYVPTVLFDHNGAGRVEMKGRITLSRSEDGPYHPPMTSNTILPFGAPEPRVTSMPSVAGIFDAANRWNESSALVAASMVSW